MIIAVKSIVTITLTKSFTNASFKTPIIYFPTFHKRLINIGMKKIIMRKKQPTMLYENVRIPLILVSAFE